MISPIDQMELACVSSEAADDGPRKILLEHDAEAAEINQVDKRGHRE